jgi:penicillin-insensitive murein endopeptidase
MMLFIRFIVLPLWLLLGLMPALAGNGWSEVAVPLSGPPQVLGSYTSGCIAGATALPLVGNGYQVMRSSRNRYYGHPVLIALVERLGQQMAERGGRLLVGDLAQPRGGPMPNGHRSHQSGLDVDIWFLQPSPQRVLTRAETEKIEMPSMILAADGVLNAALWSSRYRDALKFAARTPEVDRIFVNPIIKQALCDGEDDRAWLNKIRPWWGHDAHFHVRLSCPPDSTQCQPQKPLPPSDGCDSDLANWVRDIRQAALSPKPYRKPEPPSAEHLPDSCWMILNSPAR